MLALIIDVVSFLANLSALTASLIAIYLFFAKRKKISTALSMLVNYSYQLTLSELKEKLERLNEYDAKDTDHYDKIINILHEVVGQIKGNHKLSSQFSSVVKQIEAISDKKPLTEYRKRNIVSELRERIRHLDVSNSAGGSMEEVRGE